MLAATFSDSAPLARITRCISDGEDADDQLHHAEVIENGEQRRDENNRRQHLEREDDGVLPAFGTEGRRHRPPPDRGVAERTEDKRRADAGKPEQPVDAFAERREDPLTDAGLQDGKREDDLQAQPPGDGAAVDGPPVGGERVGDAEDDDGANERLGAGQTVLRGNRRHDRQTGSRRDEREFRSARPAG